MALRFNLDEGLAAGTRRIARSQLGIALRRLQAAEDTEREIHEARKALKRTRALLRLVRPGLDAEVFDRENRSLGSIARTLSGVRDLHVLTQTVTRLETGAGEAGAARLASLRQGITELLATQERALDADLMQAAIAALLAARKRLAKLDVRGGRSTLQQGLKRSYREARRALARAQARPDIETLHELRKQSQHHWRQMSLLHAAWPHALDVRIGAARELSQLLGEEHDLAVLQQAIGKNGILPLPRQERRWLDEICARRRADLHVRIEPLACRLFAAPPRAFAAAMAAQWRTARKHPVQAVQPEPEVSAPAPVAIEATRH
jgi:CHAD domain-containing protein